MTQGPVLFDLKDEKTPPPAVVEAPPVPDTDRPQGAAMLAAARVAARRPSRLARWFWGLAAALLGAVISVAAWDFVTGLMERVPVLGWVMTALLAGFVLVALLIALRELAAIGRLGRVDGLRRAADAALAENDLAQARAVCRKLDTFYRGREETRWGRERLAERAGEQFEAHDLLALAEDSLLAPLDAEAQREVEAAARRVATVTALVPLALADVVAAPAAPAR